MTHPLPGPSLQSCCLGKLFSSYSCEANSSCLAEASFNFPYWIFFPQSISASSQKSFWVQTYPPRHWQSHLSCLLACGALKGHGLFSSTCLYFSVLKANPEQQTTGEHCLLMTVSSQAILIWLLFILASNAWKWSGLSSLPLNTSKSSSLLSSRTWTVQHRHVKSQYQ